MYIAFIKFIVTCCAWNVHHINYHGN